jgi:DNA-binding CsgD family transcriptional regulator
MPGQIHVSRLPAADRARRKGFGPRRVLVVEPQRLTRESLVAAIDAVPGLSAVDAACVRPSAAAAQADAAVVAADSLKFGSYPLTDPAGGGRRPSPVVIVADHGPVNPLVDTRGVVVVSRDTPLAAIVEHLRADVTAAHDARDARHASGVERRADVVDIRMRRLGPPPGPPLTVRERQVLGLLASGLSPAQVARSLAITTHTARDHIKAIREKLGRPTIMAAVLEALRTGVLRECPP